MLFLYILNIFIIFNIYNMKDTPVLEHNTMTNDKLFNRNVPSRNLQPYFNVAPVCTKYSVLPILDVRKTPTEHLHKYSIYNTNNTFNPGNGGAPWSGYSSKINDESVLRNQIYGLQHSSQATYIPSSGSDLYISNVTNNNNTNNNNTNSHPLLFREETFNNNIRIGLNHHDKNHHFFGNHTRQQLDMYEHPEPKLKNNNKVQTKSK
jgi:hypothetical protein